MYGWDQNIILLRNFAELSTENYTAARIQYLFGPGSALVELTHTESGTDFSLSATPNSCSCVVIFRGAPIICKLEQLLLMSFLS